MEKRLTEKEIENIVDNTAASLAMEGMYCTEEEKDNGRKILRGELNVDDVIKEYIEANKRG